MKTNRPRYKWELLLILWVAYFLNMGGGQIYGAVLPLIKADLKVSDVGLGLVATVFILLTAVTSPIAGFLGDFSSKKWLVCLSVLAFGAATLITGFCGGLPTLVVFRGAVMGIAGALYFPAANALIGQYHRNTRGVAMAVHQTSSYIGIVVSSWIAGWVGELHGWRATFYTFGAFGLLLAAVASLRLRNERLDAAVAQSASQPTRLGEVLRPILRTPSFYCLSFAWGGGMIVTAGFLMWMPTYLYERFHLSLRDAALYAVLYHFIFALLGVIVGGRFSDRLATRRRAIRMEVKFIGWLLGAPFIWMLGACSELTMVYVALAGFGFFRGFCESNTFAALFDVIPPSCRSSATGLMIACGLAIAATSPMVLGYIKQHVDLGTGLSWLAFAYLFSAIVMFVAIKAFFPRDYVQDPVPNGGDIRA